MAHQRFHITTLRDRILAHLAASYPHGNSASGLHVMLQQQGVSCVQASVSKSLDAMVLDRWLTPPKMPTSADVDSIIDDLIADHENSTFRTKIPLTSYRLTKPGIIAAYVALARLALDRGDLEAVGVCLTELQHRLSRSRKAPRNTPIAFPGHILAVSKLAHAHQRALMRKRKPTPGPKAALRAAAKPFKSVVAGKLVRNSNARTRWRTNHARPHPR